MKFSYNWLRELVDGLGTPPRELMRLITMKTAECEGVEETGAHLPAVCAALVVSAEPIPGSTHNRKAVVETERYGVRTVVCGAPNCRPGILTAYVPPGTRLQEREIRKAVIDGIESDGMLASGQELGLNRDHTGVIELAGPVALEPDSIIEVDNKSLTHRPDLWGHHGMAREVGAILGIPLRDPVDPALLPSGAAPVKIEIAEPALCPRYSALAFENVTVQPSPPWLQYRLEAIGLNPINNIVDVTNFVMAELAQPMHAFDAERLAGDTIFVRPARLGESLAALNEENYELDESNLVIADAGGPIALAGVIGGAHSAIHGGTRRILLESANFQASGIRRTSSKFKLRTDASMRFEKAQDPVNTTRALARAVALLREVSPGIRITGGVADCIAEPLKTPGPVELPVDWLRRKLGRAITSEQVRGILESLGFGVLEDVPGVLSVMVPSWRATKDITLKDDLLEETGRMIGYDVIAPEAPRAAVAPPPPNPSRAFEHDVRALVSARGFTEVYNYSFVSDELARRFGFDPDCHIRVANPIASDQNLMRLSLIPGIWKNIITNSKHFASFRLFEIGREIHRRTDTLPKEIPHFAAAVCARDEGVAGLFELKRLAESLLPGCETRNAEPRSFEHPARAAAVLHDGEVIGRLFEFHPSLVEYRAAVLDLDLLAVERLLPTDKKYQPLRRYPASAFDLSIIAPEREPVGRLKSQIEQYAGTLLAGIEFVRQYTGAPLPAGQKSVSFRLTVGATDRTLSSEEAGAVRNQVIEGMRSAGYELRV